MAQSLTRRDVLKLGALGSAMLLLPIERIARTEAAVGSRLSKSQIQALAFKQRLPIPQVLQPKTSIGDIDFYEIFQTESKVDILGDPTKLTTIWGYNGSTPGPTIKARKGRKAIVRQINALYKVGPDGRPTATPAKHATLGYQPHTSTHLHGSASLPQFDGYASDVTEVGQYKDYFYPNIQDARTLWYHDHGVHQTASNAYNGLAAQYHLTDAVEDMLPIPKGPYDIPLTIRDAIVATDGSIVFDDNSESSVMGDVILVNGKPQPKLAVEPRKYRFRILNGSVSRSFNIGLSTNRSATSPADSFQVIATDGGLMPAPQTVNAIRHGMAERYEIVIDFSKYKPADPTKPTKVYLKNFRQANNVDYETTRDIMLFEVGATVTDTSNNSVPSTLNPNMDVMGLTAGMAVRTRRFELVRTNGSWTVNGKTWVDVMNNDYKLSMTEENGQPAPKPGDCEIWEIKNSSGGWFHPFHIHLVDFKILDRNGRAPFAFEKGPKDVVYVGENETVRVILKYEGPRAQSFAGIPASVGEAAAVQKLYDNPACGQRSGRYMAHCHNLVHEDHDMMNQFWVKGDADVKGDAYRHPIKAAPAKPWSGSVGLPAGDPNTWAF